MPNFVAVIVAAVVSFVVGFIWYSPNVFGNQWMKLSGISKKDMEKQKKQGMAGPVTAGFVAQLVMAYVLGMVVEKSSEYGAAHGLQIGFWAWLGFIATTMLGMVIWEKKPFQLYVLHAAHWLVALLIMGGILAAWS